MSPLFLVVSTLVACAPKVPVEPISNAPVEVRVPESPAEFELGPGDKISIRVWRHADLDMDVTIAPDGQITYPLVGTVQAAGLTYPELVETLKAAIATYYEDPQVSVNLVELKNQKVFVLGEVQKPSVLQVSNEMSIVEALTIAGGFNPTSRTNNVLLVRGGVDDPELYVVDVTAIFGQGDMTQMVFLQAGDIVVVPAKTITNVARYFRDVQTVLAPFLAGSAIYRNTSSQAGGAAQGTSFALE